MKFIIIRHVETIANAENKIYGWSESEYTKKGKEQINKILNLLKYENVDLIYSSPLKRALYIGELISNELNKKLIINDDLKEMNFGIFEGKTHKEVMKDYKEVWNKWIIDYKNYHIPNGENLKCVHNRVSKFLDNIKNDNGSILIVSHGGIIHSIITHLLDFEMDDRWHFKILPGSIIEIDYNDNYGVLTKIIQTY